MTKSKTIQRPLACRNAHCGAMCSPAQADGIQNPSRCIFYERRDVLYLTKAISLDRIKQVREKIENLEVQIQSYHNDNPMISQADVLKILDNLISGSEECNMRVEEMALRSEIRQMLNEAGFNRNTLKDEVKSVLEEEIKKAIRQAINETDFNGYIKREANHIIKDATKLYLQDTITRQVVEDWFHRIRVSVDITGKNGESILNPESEV